MRNIIYSLVLIFLVSCGPDLQERIIENYPDGQKKRVQYYTPDTENSYMAREVIYYENGHMKMDGYYNSDGKKHGKWTYWREDGKKWSEGYFTDGKDDKMRRTWHENGAKHYEGRYDKGTRVGKWKFYDESGKMVKEIDYNKEQE